MHAETALNSPISNLACDREVETSLPAHVKVRSQSAFGGYFGRAKGTSDLCIETSLRTGGVPRSGEGDDLAPLLPRTDISHEVTKTPRKLRSHQRGLCFF